MAPQPAATTMNVVEAALKAKDLEELAVLGERMSAKTGNAGNDAVEALVASPVATIRGMGRLLEAKALEALQSIADGDAADNEAARAEHKALCHRALASAAVVTRRTLEHGGVAAPAALKPAATLLHDMILLAPEFPTHTQDAVASMCEHWWHSEKPGREELVTKTTPYLVVLALTTGRATEVKRLNNMRQALSMFDWDDEESILSLKKLLLRCSFAPQFLRSAEGRRFLSFLFTLHPGTTRDLMAIVRNQIPAGRKSVLEHYGDVLFRAWRCAGDECLKEIEREGVQGLAQAALLASTPQMAANIRVVLDGFHAQKAHRGVDATLLRLYEPILFRALSAANPAVRRNACTLLVDAFPLQDPEADVEETDALLARQAGIINQLMGDAAPAVRAAAVEGICRILNTFWELVPAPTTAAFLAKLVDDLARDAAASGVRAAVLEGLTRLVDNPLAQPVLKAVLPRLSPLIGDGAGRVRVAMADLLLAVKSVRSLHYYDVVPLEDILLALGGGGGTALAGRLTRLLSPTYLPLGKEPSEVVRRLTALTARDEDAAAALCRHAVKEGMPVTHASGVCRALAARLSVGTFGNNNNDDEDGGGGEKAKSKGRRKHAEATAQDKEGAEEPLTTPEWVAAARALAELAAAVRDAPDSAHAQAEEEAAAAADDDDDEEEDTTTTTYTTPLGPLDISKLMKGAPSKAAKAHVLRAAAAATACSASYESPALAALKTTLLKETASMTAPPQAGSEAEEELAATLSALTAWGAAGELANAVASALETTNDAAKAAVARRCLRLLLRDQSARLALKEASALEPLVNAARTHAQDLLSTTTSSASSAAAADAATAYGKAAMHLALSGGGNASAVAALEELMSWAGGSGGGTTAAARDDQERTSSTSVPAPVLAAVLALCTEAAELGLLEDALAAAGGAARFGAGAVEGLARGRAEDAAIIVGANRAAARLAANLAAPCASGGVPAGAAAAGELAVSLLTRGAASAAAANAIAPALPTLLSGMLRQHPGGGGAPAVANSEWLAPVVAGAASLLRNPDSAANTGAADEEDQDQDQQQQEEEEEDEDVVALPKAVLAAARLPAQQVALAGALARYTAGRIKNTTGSGGSGSGLMIRGEEEDAEEEEEGGARRDGATTDVGEVKGATAMLQRLSGSGVLPAQAAAALRSARDAAAAAQGDTWAASGVTPSLTALVGIMA